jgi:hypothetical protein
VVKRRGSAGVTGVVSTGDLSCGRGCLRAAGTATVRQNCGSPWPLTYSLAATACRQAPVGGSGERGHSSENWALARKVVSLVADSLPTVMHRLASAESASAERPVGPSGPARSLGRAANAARRYWSLGSGKASVICYPRALAGPGFKSRCRGGCPLGWRTRQGHRRACSVGVSVGD